MTTVHLTVRFPATLATNPRVKSTANQRSPGGRRHVFQGSRSRRVSEAACGGDAPGYGPCVCPQAQQAIHGSIK